MTKSMNRDELERQRLDILRQMGKIRGMRRGSVSEQFLKVRRKGEDEPILRGPYYLWQYWDNGKPVRQRLRTEKEVAVARQQVTACKQFEDLCAQYVRTAEALGVLERGADGADETQKKTRRSPSRGTQKQGAF